MTGLLHVLIVEDSENDAVLMLDALRRHGFQPLSERVQNADAFNGALERRAWDAIIADYVMPQFSGPQALLLLRERGLDIPFIAVSGRLGEEAAVEMMKAGAHDYILKSNLSRLGPAVEREIEAAKSRRARTRAESAMQFLASIVESTDDAIYGKDINGTVLSWNNGAERIFGYRANEIIGRSAALLYPVDKRDELIDLMSRVRRGERSALYDTERLRKDGSTIPVSVTVSPIKNGEGETVGISTIARDISDYKHHEQERTKLIHDLTVALRDVKTLSGLLPICGACKRIRDDHGYWQQVETYITSHSNAVFTHGICPECAAQLRRELKVQA